MCSSGAPRLTSSALGELGRRRALGAARRWRGGPRGRPSRASRRASCRSASSAMPSQQRGGDPVARVDHRPVVGQADALELEDAVVAVSSSSSRSCVGGRAHDLGDHGDAGLVAGLADHRRVGDGGVERVAAARGLGDIGAASRGGASGSRPPSGPSTASRTVARRPPKRSAMSFSLGSLSPVRELAGHRGPRAGPGGPVRPATGGAWRRSSRQHRATCPRTLGAARELAGEDRAADREAPRAGGFERRDLLEGRRPSRRRSPARAAAATTARVSAIGSSVAWR